MSKKNFKNINPAMAFISDTQKVQDEQNAQYNDNTQQEQSEQQELNAHTTQSTQGRKGQKSPRINMAFSLENLEYLQLISRIEGKSITEYVNTLVRTDSSIRAGEIEQAKSVLKIELKDKIK